MDELTGLSCSVCYDKFMYGEDQSIRQFIPRILPCGHTFCTGCLEKCVKSDTIICPKCRKLMTCKGVTDLPKNFQVLTILESIEKEAQQKKEKNLCEEHKGAIPLYCYKDSCLFCIYCEVRAGKHTGHWCELATDIATPTLEGLCRWSEEIADNHDTIKKLRKQVNDTKDSIVKKQWFLKKRIMKDTEVLNDRLKKLELLDAQESLMSDIVSKCEEAYNLIQRCQNNESALGEEKFNIHQIRYDLSALLCMLESVKNNNLASFASHIQHTLENRDAIGEIRLHKPGQKGEPLAGLHQSDSCERSGADSWKMDRDVVPGHSGISEELEGAVGGQETRARQESQKPTNLEREKTNLLRLLNCGVGFADKPSLLRGSGEPNSLPLIGTYTGTGHQPLSLTCSESLPGQSAVTTDSFSHELTHRGSNKCSTVNCRNLASSHLKCKQCCLTFCVSCSAQPSCQKNRLGLHSFVPNLSKTHLPRSPKKRVEVKKAPKEEVFLWECKHCTMLNGPQVLVCLGCEALRETEAQEGRNVCPMCTLVNEPGKTKCELCETLLVRQEEQSSPDD